MVIVCHYAEIALKGKNRDIFEKKLVANIKDALKCRTSGGGCKVKRRYGRIIIDIGNSVSSLKQPAPQTKNENLYYYESILRRIPGIANFAFAEEVAPTLPALKKACENQVYLALQELKSSLRRPKSSKTFRKTKSKNGFTFKIEARRVQKSFKYSSMELNEKLGAHVADKTKMKVDLKNPDIVCFVEVAEKTAFVYNKKIKGVGGLPVSSSGKVVSLLSGGIDSPVASWYAVRRGAKAVLLHFHSFPYTSRDSIEKVKELAGILAKTQGRSTLYLAPLAEAQKTIVAKTNPRYRVILYRRIMIRVAKEIAKKEGALAIVTGESLGQVASQTLENMAAIESAATDLPILRPLIGMDKEEIIKKAREIGTYEISIQPHDDCCSLFLPQNPATRSPLKDIRLEEKKLPIKKLVRDIIKNANVVIINAQ